MKHRVKHRKFGRPTTQRLAMFRALATSLVLHGRIKTTLSKAKDLRPYVERLVTTAKTNNLASIRRVASVLYTQDAVKLLFSDIAPRMKDRNGGYTRIMKCGPRKGDAAEVAIIEFVDFKFLDNNNGEDIVELQKI